MVDAVAWDSRLTRRGTEYIQPGTEWFRAANIDPNTTSQHDPSGELAIHDVLPESS